MVDVKQILITTLEAFGYPIFLQGSLADDAPYPDSFFTFWNNATTDEGFYDNTETQIVWDFDVNFYSTDPALVNSVLLEAKASMKTQGFIIDGVGYDVMSDEPTHTGRGLNAVYVLRKRR